MELFVNKRVIGAAGVILSVLLLALSFVFNTVDRETLAESMPAVNAAPLTQEVSVKSTEFASEDVKEDVLWLARCIYSETKRADEQELVAWVVRNRVETGYRGQWTYEGVVLDPFQFSAFNRTSTKRYFYSNLSTESDVVGWSTALRVAYQVRTDAGSRRPFSLTTRHFFSERSMTGRRHPSWAHGLTPIGIDGPYDVPEDRFRFYEGIL